VIGILTLGIYAAINRYRSLGKVPIDDLGIMWIVIFSLYSTLPAMFWIFQGGEYIPLNKRLFNLGTKPEDMIYLMNLSLVCLLFFIIGNKIFLKHHSLEIRSKEIDIPFSVVIAALLVILFNALINVFFGSFGLTQEASSYAESYVITQNLPLGLRQISKLLSGFDFISWIVINIFFFKNYKKYRVYILLAALIFIILNLSGARSQIVFYLFTLLVLRHHFVRPLNLLPTLSLGIAGVVIFLGAGILRGLSGEFAIYGVGEFDMLWGNAVELLHEKQSSGLEVPAWLRYSDFYGFIPSQFLWFEKNTLSVWFMQEFYPAYIELGVGFSFGILSEMVIGYGLLDAVIRGFVLGSVLALSMNYFRKKIDWWILSLHLVLLAHAVLLVRDTAFRLIIDTIQLFLPALIFMFILGRILMIPIILSKTASEK
jgi:oligosaccharide repeat unit polymerase